MKNLFVIFIFISQTFLYAATVEQVEEYISVSTAEEELLMLEAQYSTMQNGFSKNTKDQKENYDMELLSVRFKDYLQRKLSENEMDEILQNYKKVIYLQYVSTTMSTPDKNETAAYIFTLRESEEAQERLSILEDINKALNHKDSMLLMFDNLMKPLLQNSKNAKDINDEMLDKQREAYVKTMVENANKETLYNLKDFSIEELQELLTVVKTPAMGYETKAIYGATAYALQEFFLSMASSYDASKHQAKQKSTDTNETH